jgi:hypothetical protein
MGGPEAIIVELGGADRLRAPAGCEHSPSTLDNACYVNQRRKGP